MCTRSIYIVRLDAVTCIIIAFVICMLGCNTASYLAAYAGAVQPCICSVFDIAVQLLVCSAFLAAGSLAAILMAAIAFVMVAIFA